MGFLDNDSFVSQVERAFASVIQREHLQIRDETPTPTVNDGAVVVLDGQTFRCRVVRDRGVLDIEVSSNEDPNRWFQLATFRRALTNDGRKLDNSSLESLASELAIHFEQLSVALASGAWPETRATCEAIVAADRATFAAYAESLETSGYSARAGEETRRWRRRWKFKLGFFSGGVIALLQAWLNGMRGFVWVGAALIAIAFFIPGKHRGEPLPPMPGRE